MARERKLPKDFELRSRLTQDVLKRNILATVHRMKLT